MEATYVRDHCKDAGCLAELHVWINQIVRGEMPHASASLVALVRKLADRAPTSSLFG